ncbi:MAG: hypothetical protein NC176_02950 [Treponema brennaborense]|nr:hypothetical protein [Treponema brennaborense]
MQKPVQRTVLKNDQWRYDPQTTQITFAQPMPYPQPVVHIEGIPVRPETWILRGFSGTADELLVLLDGREASDGFDYIFDAQNNTLAFREDIHPEDGNYCIQYPLKTAAGEGVRCFSNWKKKDLDTLAEMQAKHLQKLHGGPLVVVKNRSGFSRRQLRKETGIAFSLPNADSIFLIETAENGTKQTSIHCEYGDLTVECSAEESAEKNIASESADEQKQLFMQNPAVYRQYTKGLGGTPENQLQTEFVVYTWNEKGVSYRLTAQTDQQDQAENLLEKCTRTRMPK